MLHREVELLKWAEGAMSAAVIDETKQNKQSEKDALREWPDFFDSKQLRSIGTVHLRTALARSLQEAKLEWYTWRSSVEASLAEDVAMEGGVAQASQAALRTMQECATTLKQEETDTAAHLRLMETADTSDTLLHRLRGEASAIELTSSQLQTRAELAERKRAQCETEVASAQAKLNSDKKTLASQHAQLRELQNRTQDSVIPAAPAQGGLTGDDMLNALQVAARIIRRCPPPHPPPWPRAHAPIACAALC